MGFAAGEFDRRIRIERDGAMVHDGFRNVPGPPQILAKPWARWLPGPGDEKFSAAENAAMVTGRFRIRWTSALDPDGVGAAPGLNAKDWVRYPDDDAGKKYEIVAATTIGRRLGIMIYVVGRGDQ